MTPSERQNWIINYLKTECQPRETVDVLNREFVERYSADTGATAHIHPYGAPLCPTLGRDLSTMTKTYRLQRSRTGIEGMAGMGFPRWVWSYRLP